MIKDCIKNNNNCIRIINNNLKGFSLVEIMVVILLVGLLAGAATVYFMGQLAQGRIDAARSQSYEIAKSVNLYKLRFGSFPDASEGLQALVNPKKGEPLMERLPKDPWGEEYIYTIPGVKNPASFDVRSKGPDKVESDDDIGNWPEE
jgi:general secretion pathway protein G